MQIEVTEKSLKVLSENLRNAVVSHYGGAYSNVPVSVGYEMLAKTLGYKNWDTLSGLAKKSSTAELVMKGTLSDKNRSRLLTNFGAFDLYLSAGAVSEWGDGPGWARLTVTPAFIEGVREAQALVVSKKLSHIAVDSSELEWQNEDEYRMSGTELYVTNTEFWFSARPKHADYSVEAHMVTIEELCNVIVDARAHQTRYLAFADGVLFHGSNSAKELALSLLDNDVIDVNEGTVDQMPT